MRKWILILTLLLSGCANSLFFSPAIITEPPPSFSMLSSRSGNNIAYQWLPSQTRDVKGAVIHFHGNSGHMGKTQEKVDWLTEHGFHVMVFDYSGFGASSGGATDQAVYYDAITVLEYARTVKMTNDIPIYVVATSTGGNIFLRALVDAPDSVDGIVIDSSFTSYIDTAEYVVEQGVLGRWYSWIAGVVMRDTYSSNQVIEELVVEVPTLVMHCEQDAVVPITAGRELFSQLQAKDKVFWQLKDCAHARGMTKAYPENQRNILTWLGEGATSIGEVAANMRF
ncbi:hypothetical protein ABT56_15705 [Photobacterium aquae]|uniref:Serine aminopeptidase S33 domain-containing protein n=1 Tax=Photobacterium aquae TaxID=1195763 RepID=A0A0J1GX88_9GAMM|nr:alpha/beta fold hydrolase [Photobacterium aquae]KLV04064.1 hypothetical protein ABT56_15705 [Photobacterium aquae]